MYLVVNKHASPRPEIAGRNRQDEQRQQAISSLAFFHGEPNDVSSNDPAAAKRQCAPTR